MTDRRRAPLAMAVALALAAQVGWAMPARATRELRAATCCATHCGHVPTPTRSARCCGIGQDAGTAAVAPAPVHDGTPTVVALCTTVVAPALPASSRPVDLQARAPRRAGPVFLLTRSLLL